MMRRPHAPAGLRVDDDGFSFSGDDPLYLPRCADVYLTCSLAISSTIAWTRCAGAARIASCEREKLIPTWDAGTPAAEAGDKANELVLPEACAPGCRAWSFVGQGFSPGRMATRCWSKPRRQSFARVCGNLSKQSSGKLYGSRSRRTGCACRTWTWIKLRPSSSCRDRDRFAVPPASSASPNRAFVTGSCWRRTGAPASSCIGRVAGHGD